jgi:hypothetical protein
MNAKNGFHQLLTALCCPKLAFDLTSSWQFFLPILQLFFSSKHVPI